MRSKIREILNKEEGFTLVELLAVIVILGIIVAIAIPAVGSVIDRADNNADEAENALIIDAARLYVTTNHGNMYFDETNFGEVSVTKLYEEGYLEDRGTSESGNKLEGTVTIKRVEISDEVFDYTYSYDREDNPATSRIIP